jgi:hypothetical protein
VLPRKNSGRLSVVGHNARADEMSAGPMYVLLQIYPPEAAGDHDPTPLDAIAVDGSQGRLEEYLADYQERYRAACVEFAAQDSNPSGDWTSEHDCLAEAIMDQHCVYGALMAETTFKIVEVLAPPAGPRAARAQSIGTTT